MQDLQEALGHRLVRNTLSNFLAQTYVLALGLAALPYIVHRLGASLYGLVVLVATLGCFAGLVNLGVARALSQQAAGLYWKGELPAISRLFQTALAVSLLCGLTACLLLAAFRQPISAMLFHGEQNVRQVAGFAVLVSGVAVLLSVVTEVLAGLTVALQRFDIYSRVNILVASVAYLGSVLILALHFSVRAVLLVSLLAAAVGVASYTCFLRKALPGLKLRPVPDREAFWQLLRFSFFVFLSGACGVVVHRLDRVLVAYYLPMAAVAFYTIPYSLAEKTVAATGNITTVVFPSVSGLSSAPETAKLRELYLLATKMVAVVGLPVAVVLLVLAEPILHFWIGPDFSAHGALVLQLLALGFLFNICGYVPFVVAQGVGNPWIPAKFSLLNAGANVLLFILLIPRYGLCGAATAFLVSQALIIPLLVNAVNRRLDVSWKSVLLRGYFPPAACALFSTGVLLLLRSRVESFWSLAGACGIALAGYGAAILLVALDSQERTQFRLSLLLKPVASPKY